MSRLALSKMDLNSLLNLSNKEKTKATAAVALSNLGLRFKKTEHYRYFDITSLLSKDYQLASIEKKEIKEDEKIVFENGNIISKIPGVDILIKDEIDIDKNHFDQIYYINHILSFYVVSIKIDKDLDFNIIHKFLENNILLPYRIELIIDNGANVTMYEDFEYKDITDSLIFYGFDVEVKNGSTFEWVRVQDEFEKSYSMVAPHRVKVDDNSKFNLKTFDIGEGNITHNIKIDLYKDSICDAKHLVYADNNSIRSNITRINHIGQNAKTNQDARHVLKDKSTAVFDGLIKVENSAKGTITHQNSKSILLNDKAYMVSKPSLEIYIDELEASHGSTTGQIDPEEIFYIRSRGINEKDAKKMIILGFMKEIIKEVKDVVKSEEILERFEKIYNRDFKIEV